MQNKIIFGNKIRRGQNLTTKATPKTVGMPVVSGKGKRNPIDLIVTSRANSGCSDWDVPETSWWIIGLNSDDCGQWQHRLAHQVIGLKKLTYDRQLVR
jgi:hypothetical protein